jgi:hypothetical protein
MVIISRKEKADKAAFFESRLRGPLRAANYKTGLKKQRHNQSLETLIDIFCFSFLIAARRRTSSSLRTLRNGTSTAHRTIRYKLWRGLAYNFFDSSVVFFLVVFKVRLEVARAFGLAESKTGFQPAE